VNASRGCVKYKRRLTIFAICWLLAGFVSLVVFAITLYMLETDPKSVWNHVPFLFIPQLNWPAMILGFDDTKILYFTFHILGVAVYVTWFVAIMFYSMLTFCMMAEFR
jgi:hypothetical protein